MTFKDLEWKKVKELLSPYMEFNCKDGWIIGTLKHNSKEYFSYTLFTYFSTRSMTVHYITDFHSETKSEQLDWEYEICRNYFDVLRLLPKIKETYLEIKFPGYHYKLKRIQDDC